MTSSSPQSKIAAPYGSWKSPITADVVSGASKLLAGTAVDALGRLIWLESRPSESGPSLSTLQLNGLTNEGFWYRRMVLVREPERLEDHEPVDITPKDFSVRTVAMGSESGGGFSVSGDTLIFSNFEDQRLYKQSLRSADSGPVPVTPDYGGPVVCYADGVFDKTSNRYVTIFAKAALIPPQLL